MLKASLGVTKLPKNSLKSTDTTVLLKDFLWLASIYVCCWREVGVLFCFKEIPPIFSTFKKNDLSKHNAQSPKPDDCKLAHFHRTDPAD